jgi:hypothetical protein
MENTSHINQGRFYRTKNVLGTEYKSIDTQEYMIPYPYNNSVPNQQKSQHMIYPEKRNMMNNQERYIFNIFKYFNGIPEDKAESTFLDEEIDDLTTINKNNEYGYAIYSSLETFICLAKLMRVPCVRVVSHSHTMQQFIKEHTSSYQKLKTVAIRKGILCARNLYL